MIWFTSQDRLNCTLQPDQVVPAIKREVSRWVCQNKSKLKTLGAKICQHQRVCSEDQRVQCTTQRQNLRCETCNKSVLDRWDYFPLIAEASFPRKTPSSQIAHFSQCHIPTLPPDTTHLTRLSHVIPNLWVNQPDVSRFWDKSWETISF